MTGIRERSVDVGGYRLQVKEQGEGLPPVVFLHGLTGDTSEWVNNVMPLLAGADFHRLAFARPGVGQSDPLPQGAGMGVPMSWAAEQMRTLLDVMEVSAPRVLAGHSVGAVIAMLADRLWPGEVSGLVLVDPTSMFFWGDEFPDRQRTLTDSEQGGIRFDTAAMRDEWWSIPPPEQMVPCVVVSSSPDRWQRLPDDYLTDVRPLTAVEVDAVWQRRQREYAAELGAVHVVSKSASHTVHIEQPDLVALAVRSVVEAVRTGQRPLLDADQVDRLGGVLVRS